MKFHHKIAVHFLAALILFIGAGIPMVSAFDDGQIPYENINVAYIEPVPAAPLFLIQQKPATLVSTGWETSLKIPGFGFSTQNLHIPNPQLAEIGHILIFDIDSFYPCKSLLIFPFHGFI